MPFFACAFCASLFPSSVSAQNVAPSQVTPQTFAPAPAPAAVMPAAGAALSGGLRPGAPAGAEKLIFRLGWFHIEGGFPGQSDESATLARGWEGKKVSVAQIYQFARDLEQIYARAGYVLVRVAVPPQRLKDGGDVRIAVIDGFIEKVEVEAVSEHLRAAVSKRMRGLVGRRGVKLVEIERALLIAGDLPSLRLKSTLARGAQRGGAILVLEGDARPISAVIGGDNKLPQSLGGWQSNLSVTENALLGWGEQAYVMMGSGLDFGAYGFPRSPLSMIGGGFILPLGADGWTVNPEYTNSYTRLVPAPDTPATIGDFERFALRVNFPLIRDRSQTLSFGGSLERIDQSLYAPALQTDINHDSYGVARLSADWRSLSPWGAPFQANLQISQGLGGRNAADAAASQIPLSRQGATPDFSKFSTDLQLTQLVDGDLSLDVYGRAQASFGKPLFLSEQFALDGAEGLSAASDGAFNVDTGATLREELTMRCPYRADVAAVTASPYLFAAQGWGLLYQPTSVEQGETTAVALGLGAHLAWETPDGRTGGLFGLEIGRLYSNEQNLRASTRVNLSTSLHF